MKKIILATALAVAIATPAAADVLPDAMMGDWGEGAEQGMMVRAKKGEGNLHIEKDSYSAVDDRCTILKLEKQTENRYTVQARCDFDGDDDLIPSRIETDEFELLKNGKLLITPVNS